MCAVACKAGSEGTSRAVAGEESYRAWAPSPTRPLSFFPPPSTDTRGEDNAADGHVVAAAAALGPTSTTHRRRIMLPAATAGRGRRVAMCSVLLVVQAGYHTRWECWEGARACVPCNFFSFVIVGAQ
jgi:hypothetical protein